MAGGKQRAGSADAPWRAWPARLAELVPSPRLPRIPSDGFLYCRDCFDAFPPEAFAREADTGSREANPIKQGDRAYSRFGEARMCASGILLG